MRMHVCVCVCRNEFRDLRLAVLEMVYFVSLDSLAELFRPKESKRGKKAATTRITQSHITHAHALLFYIMAMSRTMPTLVSFRFVSFCFLLIHSLARSLVHSVSVFFSLSVSSTAHTSTNTHTYITAAHLHSHSYSQYSSRVPSRSLFWYDVLSHLQKNCIRTYRHTHTDTHALARTQQMVLTLKKYY